MNDLTLYDRHAAQWWDARSPFAASLHALNQARLQEISASIPTRARLVVDLGCGGGLIAEPLARAGARVIGVDISHPSLREAARHGQGVPDLAFLRATAITVPLASGCADVVIAADVLEHVQAWPQILSEAARLVKPQGLIYLNTINRTWRARLLAIGLAETLRLIPRGTHDYRMLVRPDEIARSAAAHGLRVEHLSGQGLRLWATLRHWRLHLVPGSRFFWGSYSMVLRRL